MEGKEPSCFSLLHEGMLQRFLLFMLIFRMVTSNHFYTLQDKAKKKSRLLV